MWKNCGAGQATDANMAHAQCMLGTEGYEHTLGMCNTYCSSTATLISRTRLNFPLYVACLSCNIVLDVTAGF